VGRDRPLAKNGIGLLAVAAILTIAGPGQTASAVSWPVTGLALVTAAWLAAMLVPRVSLASPAWRTVYYAGLLGLLSWLIAWGPWFTLVSWTACVYAFALFEARRAFFAAAAGGVALTAAQAGSPVPSSREALPLFVLSVVAPLLAGGWHLGRENTVRRRLIDDLAAANAGLRAASAANYRLHEQLIEQARQAGVQDERHRMAREIHDTLAQDLSAVVAQLEVALTSAEYGDQWRRPVARARDVARDGLSEARHSVRALASPLLDNAALPEAPRELAGRWQRQTGVVAVCRANDDVPPLPDEVQAALLRVAQSALANVAEHAGASQARLTLSWVQDAVLLDVWDDGAGFDPARALAGCPDAPEDRGFGLTGMRQRLSQLAGCLEIESAPGRGSAISARIPVPVPPAAGARR
jgi:signal transduction histidine kinase